MYEWAKELNCAVTVCDADATIIYMNEKSCRTFEKYGDIIGCNLKQFHSAHSWEVIQKLLQTGGSNSYTIKKNGIKKMIYQTAWFNEKKIAGLVELSMEIPEEMPHYERK